MGPSLWITLTGQKQKLELACRWLYLPDFDLPVPDQMLRDTYPRDKINALPCHVVRGTMPGRDGPYW